MKIEYIKTAIRAKQVRVSEHAKDEAKEDSLLLSEIFFSVHNGEIIEDYPKDKPYPSCLVYGSTEDGRPVHTVWAYNSDKKKAILITVYEPDSERWIDQKVRR